jgi:hypothetical protein
MPRHPTFRFDIDAPADWAPLERLAELCGKRPDLPDVDPDQFMYMGRAVRRGRPQVLLYKHIWTRRYLNLDHVGHAFAVTPVGLPSLERLDDLRLVCRPFSDVASALAWVHRADELSPMP